MDPVLTARYRALALAALARPGCPFRELPVAVAVVDVPRQRMGLLREGRLVFEAPVSTALNGIGGIENSYRTPPGWHRIARKVGEGAEPGTVFRSQMPTGEVWRGEIREDDLITTRILTLEGLEPGVNQGPGCDSLMRWIYVHGTNHEDRLGAPVSHGCLRLGNEAVVRLFEAMAEGDALVVVPDDLADGLGLGRLHFAGVAGSGMSALAQFVAMKGGRASGSDRSFDRGERPEARHLLEGLGIGLHPQDGSGLAGDCAALVVSTAVEDTVPDVAEARRRGVPVLHRSELLAHLVAAHRTVAVTGTSGKSTTTALVFELLRGAGRQPSVLTGGDLRALQAEGHWGNAWADRSDLLVIEADESDGSLVRYHPAVGVVLNLQRDHQEPAVVLDFFRTFRAQCREALVLGDDPALEPLRPGLSLRAEALELGPEGSRFVVEGQAFTLPVPGAHNVANALAALGACRALGVPLAELAAPLAAFQGVARRFQVLGSPRGVTVVDDFAHNPAKVQAALRTAKLRSGRLLAVFQPHGFGPLKFMREELVAVLAEEARPQDRFWMLPVFYAGGTARRDIASEDVVADLVARGVSAEDAPDRETLCGSLASEAQEGDLILLMGARDPSLAALAERVLARVNNT